MTFYSEKSFIKELIARKTVEDYGECGSIVTIPGFSALSDADKCAVCANLEAAQQDNPLLDLHVIDTALLDFAQEPPITPPPDPEASIARDRELENQSRTSLLKCGCPPCYPPDFDFPLQNTSEEYEIISYWQSLPFTGRVVLAAQLSDWEDFYKYQTRTRRYYRQRDIFPVFLERVRDRRRRHRLDGDVLLIPDPEQQSQWQRWIEFQNYHLELHDGYQKALQRKTEEWDFAQEKFEKSLLDDQEEVGFLKRRVKDQIRELEEHDKMLRWVGQQRRAMQAEQATSLPASRNNDPLMTSPTFSSPGRRQTDITRRSPLRPVRTAVSKQAPGKRRSLRLKKFNTAQDANSTSAMSNEPRGSTRRVGNKSSQRYRDITRLRRFCPHESTEPVKNAPVRKGGQFVNVKPNAKLGSQPKGHSKCQRAPERSTSEIFRTHSGRASKRPKKLGFVLARELYG